MNELEVMVREKCAERGQNGNVGRIELFEGLYGDRNLQGPIKMAALRNLNQSIQYLIDQKRIATDGSKNKFKYIGNPENINFSQNMKSPTVNTEELYEEAAKDRIKIQKAAAIKRKAAEGLSAYAKKMLEQESL